MLDCKCSANSLIVFVRLVFINTVRCLPQISPQQQVPWVWKGHHHPGQHSSGVQARVRRGEEEEPAGDPGGFQHLYEGILFVICANRVIFYHSDYSVWDMWVDTLIHSTQQGSILHRQNSNPWMVNTFFTDAKMYLTTNALPQSLTSCYRRRFWGSCICLCLFCSAVSLERLKKLDWISFQWIVHSSAESGESSQPLKSALLDQICYNRLTRPVLSQTLRQTGLRNKASSFAWACIGIRKHSFSWI